MSEEWRSTSNPLYEVSDDVRLIKMAHDRGVRIACLAEGFGITYRHAYKILVEEASWSSVSA